MSKLLGNEIVIIIVVCLIVFLAGVNVGYSDGLKKGRIQIMTNEYEGWLEERSDKTTYWKFKETNK